MRILLVAVLLLVGCGGPTSQPASKVWENDEVKVEILKVHQGKILHEGLDEEIEAPEKLFLILSIKNKTDSTKFDYKPWGGMTPLTDEKGNKYTTISDYIRMEIAETASIYPGDNHESRIFSEVPVGTAERFSISLPASNIGQSGEVRLGFSRSDIVEEDLLVKISE